MAGCHLSVLLPPNSPFRLGCLPMARVHVFSPWKSTSFSCQGVLNTQEGIPGVTPQNAAAAALVAGAVSAASADQCCPGAQEVSSADPADRLNSRLYTASVVCEVQHSHSHTVHEQPHLVIHAELSFVLWHMHLLDLLLCLVSPFTAVVRSTAVLGHCSMPGVISSEIWGHIHIFPLIDLPMNAHLPG